MRDLIRSLGTKGGTVAVLLLMHYSSYVPYLMGVSGAERPFDLILGALLGILTDSAIEAAGRGPNGA